jgi:RNA polymerase sigma-70 factor, ECF subfamily
VRRLDEELADGEPESVPHLPPALQLERDIAVVRDLIARLPEGEEKRTVELFYVEGELSAREIAEKLGVGKSAVTMRLERFRSRIKRELLRQVLAGRRE